MTAVDVGGGLEADDTLLLGCYVPHFIDVQLVLGKMNEDSLSSLLWSLPSQCAAWSPL